MIFEFNGILLRSADNQRSASIPATTLISALAELTARFPQMTRILLDNAGQLRQAHRMILNGELIPRPDSAMSLLRAIESSSSPRSPVAEPARQVRRRRRHGFRGT